MKTATFQVKLEASPDAEINPLHLAEEIQAYLNAHVCYDNIHGRVIGYKYEYDSFVPFNAEDQY